MRHPLLYERNLGLYYILFWGVIATCSIFLEIYWYNQNWLTASLESGCLFVLYPVLGMSIWFLVVFNFVKNNTLFQFVFHLISAIVINGIWLYLSYLIIKAIQPDHLSYFFSIFPSRIVNGLLMYGFFLVFFYATNYYRSLRENIKKEEEFKALIRDAELNALRSQINPHFLFNSLNSIASLTISSPEKAREMVVNLSSCMRYSLQHRQEETVSLEQELENIKLYLGIEKLRFEGKLNLEFDIDDHCMQAQIPVMILQPLMENAIKYGVYEASDMVWIRLKCWGDNNYYFLSIENDYESSWRQSKGEGIGLNNIRNRLELIYGSTGQMKISDNGKNFRVELGLPTKVNI